MDHFCYRCFVSYCLVCSLKSCGHMLGLERADLLALLFVMSSSLFCHFPYSVLGQVWYLIVWIPDLCILSYFL